MSTQRCLNCKHMDHDVPWETDYGRCTYPLPEWIAPARVLSGDGRSCACFAPTKEEE